MRLIDGTAVDFLLPLGYLLSADVVEWRWVVVVVVMLVAVVMMVVVEIVAITSVDFVGSDELLAHQWVTPFNSSVVLLRLHHIVVVALSVRGAIVTEIGTVCVPIAVAVVVVLVACRLVEVVLMSELILLVIIGG